MDRVNRDSHFPTTRRQPHTFDQFSSVAWERRTRTPALGLAALCVVWSS